ncbi:uncharacterized protein LOC127011783 isoform X3 [Drosophila biarmipes]|uniref:uncharacterized protein LOC127011783 isoform X1 n=1 Tax=Drosophila biarmipes TaxID=125945 RepID=UPI0021CD10E3|nr:uncharacterized protein LOC127011783 isoform X1 [Drosophila biarmipes]XP_050745820.1 uncharacterized protein LOC127011783 isoform X2 [Drosophila biarmipes]XP_050745821.1 uncharacterized protein LOC127011783 isoform X3 [Drosophila biarmipes]XP_050745822.1 uncharacterized protein LOC127011783 isoform X3 [Drosophila biarmipes]
MEKNNFHQGHSNALRHRRTGGVHHQCGPHEEMLICAPTTSLRARADSAQQYPPANMHRPGTDPLDRAPTYLPRQPADCSPCKWSTVGNARSAKADTDADAVVDTKPPRADGNRRENVPTLWI